MKAEEIIDRDYKAVGGGKYQHKDFANHPKVFPYITLLCNLRGELIDQQKAEIERLKEIVDSQNNSLMNYCDMDNLVDNLRSQLTEANQRGEKLATALSEIFLLTMPEGSVTGVFNKIATDALSEYESTKVKPVDQNEYDITKQE